MATTTTRADVVFPPRDLSALLDLGRFLQQHTEPGLLLGPDGEQVPLPEEVYRVLADVVETMRQGKAITLVPHTSGSPLRRPPTSSASVGRRSSSCLKRGRFPTSSPAGTAESCSRTCSRTRSSSMRGAAQSWTG